MQPLTLLRISFHSFPDSVVDSPRRNQTPKMRKFDPWPVFFRREFNRNWPFLVGFAITGAIITKISLGVTEEDVKNSPFAQRHGK